MGIRNIQSDRKHSRKIKPVSRRKAKKQWDKGLKNGKHSNQRKQNGKRKGSKNKGRANQQNQGSKRTTAKNKEILLNHFDDQNFDFSHGNGAKSRQIQQSVSLSAVCRQKILKNTPFIRWFRLFVVLTLFLCLAGIGEIFSPGELGFVGKMVLDGFVFLTGSVLSSFILMMSMIASLCVPNIYLMCREKVERYENWKAGYAAELYEEAWV